MRSVLLKHQGPGSNSRQTPSAVALTWNFSAVSRPIFPIPTMPMVLPDKLRPITVVAKLTSPARAAVQG